MSNCIIIYFKLFSSLNKSLWQNTANVVNYRTIYYDNDTYVGMVFWSSATTQILWYYFTYKFDIR
jgi:hypothetical protein